TSLVCAEEAARVEPRSVEAHHDRAAALQEIGRLDEAESAFTRALALDPDDPETLAGAADLYINRLPPTNDHTETGLEFARRGSRRLKRVRAPHGARPDRALVARLALLEGQALNDLGRSREALMRLDAALAAVPDDLHARYERAVALFDLCRFAESKRAFTDVLAKNPHDAWAHHHLGLTLERLGDVASADRELARARIEAPAEFHAPVEVSPAEFRSLVDNEAKKLPVELRADLGRVSLETADLPDLSDLTAEEPPLAPTILGLFRGAPIGEAPEAEARAIVIYRKNLARAVASRDELIQQIRTTLLHELGHLRGEDDDALRARGLE
ncbi:MAG TPA: metallopeptidase family protein, partial [Polyangia bacterium]